MKYFGVITMTFYRRLPLSACHRHEPQRDLDVFAAIGVNPELVQNKGRGGLGTRCIILMHLHFHSPGYESFRLDNFPCGVTPARLDICSARWSAMNSNR